MILTDERPPLDEVTARTGWEFKPEGACRGEACVPMPDGPITAQTLAERLRMPLVHDERHGLWALGPETGEHALRTAESPPLTLPDLSGAPFDVGGLRGRKVLLLAWASW